MAATGLSPPDGALFTKEALQELEPMTYLCVCVRERVCNPAIVAYRSQYIRLAGYRFDTYCVMKQDVLSNTSSCVR